jgi:hypothetical protein
VADKKKQDRDRRAKIEELRKAEQARERRKSLLIVIAAVVVGLALIAAAAVPAYLRSKDNPENKALSSFGVKQSAASCADVVTDEGTNTEATRQHVEDGTKEDYETVPPSYGPHWSAPAFPAREFYTERDRPEMEQLVHNLEHGYTILWYDDTIKGDQLDTLKDIATSARANDAVGPNGKFIVSAWDDFYGAFPKGKHIGMSHWGAESSAYQLCGKVSGEVVQNFIEDHPASDAPEPNAA